MRVELGTETRVGITKDVLDVVAKRNWLVRGVEVVWHQIYLDIPDLQPEGFGDLSADFLKVPGVWSIRKIDLMPGERRRMHFDVLLSALPSPVLAIDNSLMVVAANKAAIKAFAIPEARINTNCGVKELLDTELSGQIISQLKKKSGGEVSVFGKPMLVDVLPLGEDTDEESPQPHGAVLIFRSPSSLGQDLYAISKMELPTGSQLIGESAAMKRIAALIQRFGQISAPLLITGETGTGKELVARACHRASKRSNKPFLALNCAALPESLAESELFGYAAGAFSGAQKTGKPGLFELADGGTVFLDEIGEMSPYLQAKLLRFLQDCTFVRVGGKSETRVDLRLLAATHRDLKAMVKSGEFREDLYYRLHVLGIEIPPLRERREDIRSLSEYFVARAATQIGVTIESISEEVYALLFASDWPGNARQLENSLFRAVSLCEGPVLTHIDIADISKPSLADTPALTPSLSTASESSVESYADAMERVEREMLTKLYVEYPSSRKLAQRLGLSHTAVANKLKKFGIH